MPRPGQTLLLALGAGLLAASPGRGAGAPEPPAEAVVGELPFARDDANRVYVDLAPEGSPSFTMMLDTGASQSGMTPLMARSLGVHVRRNKSSFYRRTTRLGRDLQFWVDTDSSDTGSKTGWEYGLLGGEFLDDYVVEVDFPGRRVRLLDPRRYEVPKQVDAPDEAVIPLKLVATRISIPVEVGGHEVRALFDTGSPIGLSLAGKAAERIGIDVDALQDFGEMGTVLGSERVRLYEAPTLSVAGFTFEGAPVIVAPRGGYQQGLATDNAIGYDLMHPFVLRIDYKRRRMWLHRTAPLRVTLFGADYALAKEIGAYLTPVGGTFNVWGVTPGGPASSYGLRDGDAVVAPAGQAPPKLEDVLGRIRARQELTVARKVGEVWTDLVLPEDAGAP